MFYELQERMLWGNWVPLVKVAEVVRSTISPQSWRNRSIQYIRLTDVVPETFTISNPCQVGYNDVRSRARYEARDGDVVIGIIGPSIGEVNQPLAIITEEYENALISSGFALIRCTDINPY